MASITASFPSFLSACFGRPETDDSGRTDTSTIAQPEPHSCSAVAMASDKLDDLVKGASHSRRKILQSSEMRDHFDTLAKGQSPKYYVIACSDSRVSPPEIFGVKPGSMFEMQVLGALMPHAPVTAPVIGQSVDGEWANVYYAVVVLKVEHLIIMGHEGCGAVAGIMSPDAISQHVVVAAHLHKHRALRERVNAQFSGLKGQDKALAAVGESVLVTLEKVMAFEPVKTAVAEGRLQVHAMVYEISNHGGISVWDADKQEFVLKNPEKPGDHSIMPKRAGHSANV